MNAAEEKSKSLVCLDLETTNLREFGPAKITECGFVGVVRSHIKADSFAIPRVLHKLNFSVYPQAIISFDSTNITGLSNDLLEHIKPWDINTFQMVLTFLNLLPPPVCLVAYNGNRFDFPILRKQIQHFNQSFPDHVVCVDAWKAFQTILGEDTESSSIIKRMKEDMTSDNDILIQVAEEIEAIEHGVLPTKHPEITPDSKIVPNLNLDAKQRKNVNPANEIPSPSRLRVKRCLFPSERPVSYKLSDIYSHLYNQPPERAHNAEGDAITLLKCILKVAPEFLDYADEHSKAFNSL